MIESITLSGRFNTHLARKPASGPGTAGRPVRLLTNLFGITVKEKIAFHYDLTFKGEKKVRGPPAKQSGDVAGIQYSEELKIRKIVTSLFDQLKQHDEDFAGIKSYFDGRQNMYTLRIMLPQVEKEVFFEADIEGEKRNVKARYVFTGHTLDLTAGAGMTQDAVQALEIGLGFEVGRQMIQRGSKFFERSVAPMDVGLNLELRMGFVKSVKVTESGLCINLDRAAALFQMGGMLPDVMMNIVNFGASSNRQYTRQGFVLTPTLRDNLERELSNLRIEFRNPGLDYSRKYKVERHSFTREKCDSEDVRLD